jgi:hypothetical protein
MEEWKFSLKCGSNAPAGESAANEAATRFKRQNHHLGGRRLLPVMDKPWFDQDTGTLLLDQYVVEMDSYRRIVEDEVITDAELVEQTQRVTSLLQRLEETLSPEAKALVTEAMS